jgi:tetratricopeptide (TPR) repeat protein
MRDNSRDMTAPWLPVRRLDYVLRRRWQAGLFFTIVAFVAVLIGAESVRFMLVASLENSTDVSKLNRALALDPRNPVVYSRLARVYAYSSEQPNLKTGMDLARRAVELSPHNAVYRESLATLCESAGEVSCAKEMHQEALALSPMTPQLWWNAANFYLRTDDPRSALPYFKRLLELGPTYAAPTFRLCFGTFGDPALVLESLLPKGTDPTIRLRFADYLSATDRPDAAYQVWRETEKESSALPLSSVQPYLDRLLGQGRYEEAYAVWSDLVRDGVVPRPADGGRDNLIFNGGFEQAPLNAGFDWHLQSGPYATVGVARDQAYQGALSLRVDFTVPGNQGYEPAYQSVPVVSGQSYVLTAYVRTSEITSDSGPRLRVVDPDCPACLTVSTESATGTSSWHSVNVSLSAGTQTRVVRVSVWRPPSRTFPMDISGTFWLDDVSLHPVNPDRAEESTVANH